MRRFNLRFIPHPSGSFGRLVAEEEFQNFKAEERQQAYTWETLPVTGNGNKVFQICYALKGGDIGEANTLGALSANTAYSVTFTYTATKK